MATYVKPARPRSIIHCCHCKTDYQKNYSRDATSEFCVENSGIKVLTESAGRSSGENIAARSQSGDDSHGVVMIYLPVADAGDMVTPLEAG